ncbi:LuxR C-terminal-related transcriptional regulator [Aquihabitans sp. McL0605]|uniref:helix-turn-helix transcriptional regulator n=1 Tax=Aquihabitans sp. McL0605 TaxID=3415671 RepID=UPI003CF3E873
MVERADERAVLEGAAASAHAGTARLVLVTGEAGIGKTRLVEALLSGLDGSWTVVFLEDDGGVLRRREHRREAVAADSPAADAPVDDVLAAMRTGPAGSPTVVVVESIESLAPASIADLGIALDAVAAEPVLVLATLRTGVLPPGSQRARALAGLLRRRAALEVPVPPLTVGGIEAMAAALGRSVEDAAGLLARTAGNPFFVEEVLLSASGRPPWTVTEAVLGRVDALSPEARHAAELLALSEGPLDIALLSAACGGTDPSLALLDAAIAVPDGPSALSLRHGLVSEVIVSRMPADIRRHHHEQLARSLSEQRDTSSAVLAHHWEEAGFPAEAALTARQAAAEAMAARAYRTATEHFRLAIRNPDLPPLDRAELLDQAAVSAGWAGADQEAISWATEADAAYRAAGEAWRAVAMWLSPGLNHIPKPVLDQALLADDAVERLFAEERQATLAGELEQSATLLRRALHVATDRGAGPWIVQAGFRLTAVGQMAEGETVLHRVKAQAVARRDHALVANVLSTLAYVEMSRGEMAKALVVDREALAAARRGETAAYLMEAGVATLLAYLGDLDEADELIAEVRATDSPIAAGFADFPACIVDIERGDLDAAWPRLTRMDAVAALGIMHLTIGVHWVRARAAYQSGDPADALAELAAAAALSGDVFEPTRPSRLLLQATAAAEIGDDDAFDRAAADVADLQARGAGREIQATLETVAGLAATRDQDHAAAATHHREAASRWLGSRRFIGAAEAWAAAAEAHHRAGDAEGRSDATERARAVAEPRGLRPVLARLQRLDVAEPPVPRDPRLDVLTPRERAIALAVATGQTNRQVGEALFISEHTVRNQLVSVFAKLGVSRRGELIALLRS